MAAAPVQLLHPDCPVSTPSFPSQFSRSLSQLSLFLPPGPPCFSQPLPRAGQGGSLLLSQRKRRKCCSICSASSALAGLQRSAGSWAGRQKGRAAAGGRCCLSLRSSPSRRGRTSPARAPALGANPLQKDVLKVEQANGEGEKPLSDSTGGILVDKCGHLA